MSAEKKDVAAAQGTTEAQPGLLKQIIQEARWKDETTVERGRDLIKQFVEQVLERAETVSRDAQAMINARIVEIDRLMSSQLNEVLHNKEFQQLEASWRGLKYLVSQSETGTRLKIRVLNVSKADLAKDFERAAGYDQSELWKKVYEGEYGIFGGEPYAAMIGNYEFGRHPEDVELLEKLSGVAAAAHAPFLSAASPELLNLPSFTNLTAHRNIAEAFDGSEFAKWKSFRQSEDSRYIALALPHILMRLPYGRDTKKVDAFNYEEEVDGTNHGHYLWGNAAWALGARLTNAFAKYGWCVAIRGVEGGGLVEGLPAHTFKTEDGDIALKCPTEIEITDRREKELSDNGLVPLVHCKGTDYAAFFGVQSTNKPKVYDKDEANANARLSAQIPYIMAVSRFAHYMKAMMRDKIGGFMSRKECQDFLNQWILQYVVGNPDSVGPEIKAQKPLSDARVEVEEVAGKPGVYRAVAYLRPHFQLEELNVSLRLVAELPPGRG